MNLSEAIALTRDLDSISTDIVAVWAVQHTGGNQAAVIAAIAKERQRRAAFLASKAGTPVIPFMTAVRLREWRAKQAAASSPRASTPRRR